MSDTTSLRELPAKWRRLSRYEEEDGELSVGDESAIRLRLCADELEAALSARDEAGAVDPVQWLRDNYHAYPNIASLCDAMRAAIATPPASGEAGAEKCECGGIWCDYVHAEYKNPPPALLTESPVARYVKTGVMCDKCGAIRRLAAVAPDDAAFKARMFDALTEDAKRRGYNGLLDVFGALDIAAVAPAGMDGWQATAHELLQRLQTAQPPNVLLHHLQILGDMAALLRCMFPTPPATAGEE